MSVEKERGPLGYIYKLAKHRPSYYSESGIGVQKLKAIKSAGKGTILAAGIINAPWGHRYVDLARFTQSSLAKREVANLLERVFVRVSKSKKVSTINQIFTFKLN